MPLEKFSLLCPQIQFPSYGSDRDSTERHVKPRNFLPVVSWLQELFLKIPAFVLDMRHVYIQYFWLPRFSPLWCSGTSFASHGRGLGFEPGRVRSCISCFFMWFRLSAKSFQNRALICHSRNTVPLSVFNQGVQTSGVNKSNFMAHSAIWGCPVK